MPNETKNNEGPACACGRVDIYKETLKLKKNSKDEDADSTASCQAEDVKSSDTEINREDQR